MLKFLNPNLMDLTYREETNEKTGNTFTKYEIRPLPSTSDKGLPPLTRVFVNAVGVESPALDSLKNLKNTVFTGILKKNTKGYDTLVTKINENDDGKEQDILIAAIPFNGTLVSVNLPSGLSVRRAQVVPVNPFNFDSDKYKVSKIMYMVICMYDENGAVMTDAAEFPKEIDFEYITSTLAPDKDKSADKCVFIKRTHNVHLTFDDATSEYTMTAEMHYTSSVISNNEKPDKIAFSDIFPVVYDNDVRENKDNASESGSKDSAHYHSKKKDFTNTPFKDLTIPAYEGNERERDNSRRRNKKGKKHGKRR